MFNLMKNTNFNLFKNKKITPKSTNSESIQETISNNEFLIPQNYNNYNKSNISNKLPDGWELEYDNILCQFYYINKINNIIQFDSPLEELKYST